jgi:hypothetical protein
MKDLSSTNRHANDRVPIAWELQYKTVIRDFITNYNAEENQSWQKWIGTRLNLEYLICIKSNKYSMWKKKYTGWHVNLYTNQDRLGPTCIYHIYPHMYIISEKNTNHDTKGKSIGKGFIYNVIGNDHIYIHTK